MKKQRQEPPKEVQPYREAIPWGYLISYVSYFYPKLTTGTSTVQQEHLRFLLPEGHAYGNDGLGYPLFVFKLHFQLEIYSILKLCIYTSVSKSVKEITSGGKKRQISQCKLDFIAFI